MFKSNRQTCPSSSVPYIIRKGDTLSQIAKQYNANLNEIILANPNIIPNNLIVGEQICIPLPIQYYPTCTTTNYYVVREYDTFESIAKYFNVTYYQLYYANYGINPNELYKDQILCIPVAPAPVEILINTSELLLSVIRNNTILVNYPIINKIFLPNGEFLILNKQLDTGIQTGARYLGLSQTGLGIHGVNTPQFIDKLNSNQNIILSNEDIDELFNLVTVGTMVKII